MNHKEYIIPIGEEAKEFDEMFIGVIRRHPVLIRCKDCKHCMIFSMFTSKWYVCCRNEKGVDVKAEDFCSYAERGKDEAD